MLRAAAATTGLLALAPAVAQARFGDHTLRRGAQGHDVRVLQSWLTHLGFRTAIDGGFGASTQRSVQRWEAHSRLRRDGVVTPADAGRMREQMHERADSSRRQTSYRFGERTLRRGARGHDVRVLQSWLTRLGVSTSVDGVFGRGTEHNVKAYELRENLERDGQVDKPEAAHMRSEVEDGQPAAHSETGDGVFPVRGAHRYGQGFGAPRSGHSHQGQDVFADCGTRLVSAEGGKVVYSGYQSAAGNYTVIKSAESGRDMVYMHLRSRPAVDEGDSVTAGQTIGSVGATGDADGCHLHFELWTSPGWYNGGHAIDPLPTLKRWDAGS